MVYSFFLNKKDAFIETDEYIVDTVETIWIFKRDKSTLT